MRNFMTRLLRTSSSASQQREPLHLLLQPQQILHDRYKILKRLGQGVESTVWLAEELGMSNQTVALKILTDYATSLQEVHAFELRVMERVSHLPPGTPGLANLPSLIDHFSVPGVRGSHLCLVTEALGPTVLQVQKTEKGRAALPPQFVKHLTRQLLRALEALHDGCHAVHTDIKPDNMLFRRSTLKSDSTFDGRHAFDPDNVVLIDLGTAMPMEVKSDRIIQPIALRCPEVLLGCRWGPPADIWNLGCIIFELLTLRNLFDPEPIGNFSAEKHQLARMYGTLVNDADHDRLVDFFKNGRKFNEFFDEDRKLFLTIDPDAHESLQEILEIYRIYTPELLELLTAMLQVHPEDRPSAKQLQGFAWLRG